MDNNATWAVFFIKNLIKELGLKSPYDYVRENEWTLDRYHELSAAAAKDLNGDGIMDPDNDRWGTVGDYLNTFMLYIASGEKAIKKDADDIPYLETINERGAGVMDKVMNIQLDKDSTLHANEYSSKYANVYSDMLRRNFKEDRALFYIAGLLSYTLLRDMESEFGMVPMPKYEPAQDRYYTTYNYANASSVSIPATNAKPAKTGLVVEALAAESMYTLTPAYYNVALERKYMRDEESREMLDIILSSRIVDLDIIYNWGGSYMMFEDLTGKKSRDFTSEFEKIRAKAEAEIAKTVESFGKVD
jgi:ABC-type glycerol-3-phosphate transport system substrate-binding protein